MRVLVINLGWEQEPLIECLASRNGLELYGIHYDDKPYGVDYFKNIVTIDLRNLQQIIEYSDHIKPQAIISDQCDYSLFAQSLLAHRYNLPGPTFEASQFSNNKYLQRLHSKKTGIKIPEFELCWTPEHVHAFAGKYGYPIIIKPVDNRGSFGVLKIENEDAINLSFYNSIIHSHSRTLLIEEFIEGMHITVDGYAFPENGNRSLALATKRLDPKNSVAMEIVYPGDVSDDLFGKALEVNEVVNKKLGYSFGMTHSEYMIRGDEIFLIESANRGGGVFTSEIIAPYSADVDLVSQYVSDCLGERVDLFKSSRHLNIVLRFFSFKLGKVKLISGWHNVRVDKNVLKCDLSINPGDTISSITSDANRHGYIIYKGTAQEANDLLDKVEVTYEE